MSGESSIEYTEAISGYNRIGCAMPTKVPHCHCLGAGRGPISLGCGLVGSTRWRTLGFPERKRESHLLNNCSILDIVTTLVDQSCGHLGPPTMFVRPQGYIIRNPCGTNAGKSGEDRFNRFGQLLVCPQTEKRESGNNLCGRFDHYKNGNQPFQLVNAVECCI